MVLRTRARRDIGLQNQQNLVIGDSLRSAYTIESTFNKFTKVPDMIDSFSSLPRNVADIFNNDPEGQVLKPNEANAEFKNPLITFDQPIKRRDAKQRILEANYIRKIDQVVDDSNRFADFGDKASNFLYSMGTAFADPMLALNPIVKLRAVSKLAQTVPGFNTFIKNPFTRRALIGATENAIQDAATQPLIAERQKQLGLDYTAEDAFFSVGTSLVFGGGLGLLGSGYSRAFGTQKIKANRARSNGALNNITSKELGQVLVDIASIEGEKAVINLDDNITASFFKLDSALNFEKSLEAPFTSDFLFRNDLKNLGFAKKISLADSVARRNLIDPSIFDDLQLAFETKSKLPDGKIKNLVELGDSPNSIVTLNKVLKAILPDNNLRSTVDLKSLARFLGLEKIKLNSGITIKQGHRILRQFDLPQSARDPRISIQEQISLLNRELAATIEPTLRSKIKKQINNLAEDLKGLDPIDLLERMQQEMRLVTTFANTDFNIFRKRFLKIRKNIIDNPSLRNKNIFDYNSLNLKEKQDFLEFTRFMQESGVTPDQIDGVMKNDSDTLQQVYDQLQLNSTLKDVTNEYSALNNVQQYTQKGLVSDYVVDELINKQALSEAVNENLTLKDSHVAEEVELLKSQLDEDVVKRIEDNIKTSDVLDDNLFEGYKAMVDCVFGT